MMLKLLRIADFVTLLNALCGLLSIFMAIEKKFNIAGILIILAVIFDFFDGHIARLFKQSSQLGKDLDSLADLISFGIAPIVLTYMFLEPKSHDFGWFVLTFSILFVFAGVIRLAKFNSQKSKTPTYEGMPITFNGILIPFIIFLNLSPALFIYIPLATILMISPFKFNKPFIKKKKNRGE